MGVDITPIRLDLLGLKGIMQMEKSSTSNQLFLLRSCYIELRFKVKLMNGHLKVPAEL